MARSSAREMARSSARARGSLREREGGIGIGKRRCRVRRRG